MEGGSKKLEGDMGIEIQESGMRNMEYGAETIVDSKKELVVTIEQLDTNLLIN